MNRDLKIINGDKRFFKRIISLCDERYGKGYIDEHKLETWIENKELFKIALIDGEFAGFSVMISASLEKTASAMGMEKDEIASLSHGKPILIYKSAAVEKKFSGLELGKILTKSNMEDGQNDGFGTIFGSAWICENEYIPMEKTFSELGFTRLSRKKMLWYDDLKYCCIICNGRCKCDAMIFFKKLYEEHEI